MKKVYMISNFVGSTGAEKHRQKCLVKCVIQIRLDSKKKQKTQTVQEWLADWLQSENWKYYQN